jgi:hypothetical protein
MSPSKTPAEPSAPATTPEEPEGAVRVAEIATEIGGRDGPDPTRYGDWEKNGRCIDF